MTRLEKATQAFIKLALMDEAVKLRAISARLLEALMVADKSVAPSDLDFVRRVIVEAKEYNANS